MKRAVPSPTAWAREGKRSARALLRAELNALEKLRHVISASTDRTVAALAALPIGDDRRAAAERAIDALRGHAAMLLPALQDAIATGRLGGKRAALARLDAEWSRVRAEVTQAKIADPGPLRVPVQLTGNDNASADAAASSLSGAWLATATAAVWTWAEDDGEQTFAGAVSASAAMLDSRARRTAATETARAFADGRDEGMGWLAEQHSEATWFPAVLKVWDATNDKKLCPRCAALDGKMTLLGLPFEGGQTPGYVHPACRCIPGIVFLPARIHGASQAGRQVDDERPREAA